MSTVAEDVARVRAFAALPTLYSANGTGGFSYRVVEHDGRFVVLILRDSEEPRISRSCTTLNHARREVENLVAISRAMRGRVSRRAAS